MATAIENIFLKSFACFALIVIIFYENKDMNLDKSIKTQRNKIFLCVTGTVLEWYDFSLFACLAPVLLKVFFPLENHAVALMYTFMAFTVGFVVRPLGAVVFGHFGDKVGRKITLFSTIFLMTIATTSIGLLPVSTHSRTSLCILFITLRIIQGFAGSGEYAGIITMLSEFSSNSRRGLIASLGIFSAILGAMFGSLISIVISLITTEKQMLVWGWRIPFLLGFPLGVVGFLLRCKLHETNLFEREKQNGHLSFIPLLEVIKNYFSPLVIIMCLYILASVGYYINFIYLPNYLVSIDKISYHEGLITNLMFNFIYVIFLPLSGYLSDIIGRQIIMKISSLSLIFLAYPLFYIIFNLNTVFVFIGQGVMAFLIAIFVGPLASFSTELFPTKVRYTAIALALNLPNAIFGGLTPFICTLFLSLTHNNLAPSYYLMAAGLFAFLGIALNNNVKKYLFNSLALKT